MDPPTGIAKSGILELKIYIPPRTEENSFGLTTDEMQARSVHFETILEAGDTLKY